eukprot:TRINITY_DN73_c0_g1_i5.p1 TRINITY_DN73_c0_g1~~TRINITY_DN73_c0_g1_i5.p1  ORF type:complete len:159 (+),score=63.02 TRINITY_DN73_c0_g1_i5:254-730(+)
MDFDFVPYGNAYNESGTIKCQHGATECRVNMAEACVKNMTGNAPLQYMPFVQCVVEQGSSQMQGCAEKLGLDWSAVDACMQNGQGKLLIDIEGRKTEAANIPYTPYLTCNGRQVSSASAITGTVCGLWTGTKPPCCSSSSSSSSSSVREVNATRSYPH